MTDPGRVLVIGAGPTGLGCAIRLHEHGHTDVHLLDRRPVPGGLASSFVDANGFTWDIGGHVQFSHYAYYDQLCDRVLGDAWLHHERESWIWIRDRFVPYPFQYNIHRLDDADCTAALRGIEAAVASRSSAGIATFEDWLLAMFGRPLSELFFFPYNEKVWGVPPRTMDAKWMGERVAVPDLDRLRRNVAERRDDVSWGPNNRFRFPLRGGTGSIWEGAARLLPPSSITYGADIERVDLAARRIALKDGGCLAYDTLVSTIPLDVLCAIAEGAPTSVVAAAEHIRHSAVHVIGIGLQGDQPETLRRKCWMYFPEPHSPYFRVTVFSNYSPHHVPDGDGYWSLMAEVCETSMRPVGPRVIEETIAAMRRDGLIGERSRIASRWHHREEYGYPTPFRGRDETLEAILPVLERRRVFSRGRFGAWKYEVSNQDHACMQGVELADRLVGIGDGEPTLHRPDHVNSGVYATKPQR